jgi:hypothetical protein
MKRIAAVLLAGAVLVGCSSAPPEADEPTEFILTTNDGWTEAEFKKIMHDNWFNMWPEERAEICLPYLMNPSDNMLRVMNEFKDDMVKGAWTAEFISETCEANYN